MNLASAANPAAGNLTGMDTFIAYDLSAFLINAKPTFIKGPRIWSRNPPDCIISDGLLFY